MHILSLILWTPLLGALLAALAPPARIRLIRGIAFAASGLALVLAWSLPWFFDTANPAVQFAESRIWNPELSGYYALGIDGFSLPILLLSTLLCVIALLASGCWACSWPRTGRCSSYSGNSPSFPYSSSSTNGAERAGILPA